MSEEFVPEEARTFNKPTAVDQLKQQMGVTERKYTSVTDKGNRLARRQPSTEKNIERSGKFDEESYKLERKYRKLVDAATARLIDVDPRTIDIADRVKIKIKELARTNPSNRFLQEFSQRIDRCSPSQVLGLKKGLGEGPKEEENKKVMDIFDADTEMRDMIEESDVLIDKVAEEGGIKRRHSPFPLEDKLDRKA